MVKDILKTPWPSILWTGLIFILLSIDTGSLESASRIPIPHFDKIVHFGIFGLYAWIILKWRASVSRAGIIIAILSFFVSSLYGTAMEFYQEKFTAREFELGDIYADTIGALVATIGFMSTKSPYGNRGRNQN
jgi:VanZ family protein